MKSYHFRLGILCLGLIGLSSCADNTNYFNTQVKPDLSRETWLHNVNLDPNQWTRNADSWFLTGKPTPFERADNNAPYSKAMTTMMVRVPDFTTLKVEGRIHVQLVGRQEHNSAYVYGPNDAVRQTIVEVRGDTLYVHETKDCSANYMNQVVVRIGLHNISKIISAGNVNIEGKEVTSDALTIKSSSTGDTILAGNMNLMEVVQAGTGAITVLGADTPSLNIKVISPGSVNVNGRVGAHYLTNNGGIINILGADSDSLSISSTGKGSTSVAGYANVKKITAINDSKVYLYWVNSSGAYVSIYDHARVGLAGATKNLNVDVSGSGRFEGQYLRGENIFVRTRDWSHANVNASKKLFAAAMDSSSIYFFGSPNIVSRYTARDGIVLPVWSDTTNLPTTSLPPAMPRYNDEQTQTTHVYRGYKGDGSPPARG